MEPIPLFKPTYNIENCLNEIEECLKIGWTGMGYKTEQFEFKWCEYTKSKYSYFTNSSTSGLNLAVEILGRLNDWDESTEIITTPITFISTNHAILHRGYRPVFADCDNSGNISLASVKNCISKNTKCLIFVGLGGNFGELEEISGFCKSCGIKLIVDAAHMAGSRHNGHFPNHFGDITVYSFQAVKNLPTADSGMLCTQIEEIDTLVRRLGWLGINKDTFERSKGGSYKWDYDVTDLGYKYHGNSIIASIGIAQLRELEQANAKRRTIAEWYNKYLDYEYVQTIVHRNHKESSYHLCQILTQKRDELIQHLSENKIGAGVHYKDNTTYKLYDQFRSEALRARRLWTQLLSLPCHVDLSEDDVKRVANTVNSFFCN